MRLDEIYKNFQRAIRASDVEKICAAIIEVTPLCKEVLKISNQKFPDKMTEIILRGETLIYQSMRMLELNEPQRAAQYFQAYVNLVGTSITAKFLNLFYLLARIHYKLGNFSDAAKNFAEYEENRFSEWRDVDELSLFYHANSVAMEQNFPEAIKLYQNALKIKSDFPEAEKNLALLLSGEEGELVEEVYSLWQPCAWQDVPIFINARDRLGVMKKLIDWLLEAGYRNLIILDNDSTYPELLTYYSELEKNSCVKIILLGANFGYKALWQSRILEKLKISTPYVYTDPDIVPDRNCPKNFVEELFAILNEHREFRKVAPSPVWEDITFFAKDKWQEIEKSASFRARIGEKLCYANVDTTFALYSNTRNYSLRSSLRTLGDMRIRHLPWYFDYDNLPEDEQYYMEHAAKNSITTVKR